MLTKYIYAAMDKATYEQLPDGTFYGEIPVQACGAMPRR